MYLQELEAETELENWLKWASSPQAANLELEAESYRPSPTRRAFEAAVQKKEWKNAYSYLNGLNMYEMLRALDNLDRDKESRPRLKEFWGEAAPYRGMVNISRIYYAYRVVRDQALSIFSPDDLQKTGQVQTAAEYLSRKKLPPLPTPYSGPWLPFQTIGIDVSQHQGHIDWKRVEGWRHWERRLPIDFVFIRAANHLTEDTKFKYNWEEAGKTRILRSPYQYFHSLNDGKKQAQKLYDIVKAAGGFLKKDLPPVIDVEAPPGLVKGSKADKATAANQLHACLLETAKLFQRKPIIYTGFYFWDPIIGTDSRFDGYKLWIAQYDNPNVNPMSLGYPKSLNPKAPAPFPRPFRGKAPRRIPHFARGWDFWQFRVVPGRKGWAEVDGIKADLDFNAYNGTYENLRNLIN